MKTIKACALLVLLQLALPALACVKAIPVYAAKVVAAYPHDSGAFTQGLFFKDGFIYESTGLKGRSSIRKVALETGQVVQSAALPADVFGEGISDWADSIIGLTWTEQTGFVFDLKGLTLRRRFSYAGEGWGLTRSDKALIMSDGTSELRFLHPATLREMHRVRVTADGEPVAQLNELEWVEGEVYANIWQTDRIARIDPVTGKVVGWIDLAGLLSAGERSGKNVDVLNGIAYDAKRKRLFVTGKLWPKLFEIKLVKQGGNRK
ncbi:glutaminyl-peptide cyclotransferase [Massilia glaciei]|uniref:Glutaminyl-peptide cyclotransferase n=1 Tax=Massilia glaciei TaxID=1524097 RepID=A0A2U2HFP1_9BURK|nr:glutaminyl-peptide cyclotransferase [Massilia glaciei]PWF43159.1 glutaminyl-peptide cyclotransferase [Massilia glaciei]